MFRQSEVAVPRRTLFILGYLVAVAAIFSGSEAADVHAPTYVAPVVLAPTHAGAATVHHLKRKR
jgi:cytochrome b561